MEEKKMNELKNQIRMTTTEKLMELLVIMKSDARTADGDLANAIAEELAARANGGK
jgi:hypothetical protein